MALIQADLKSKFLTLFNAMKTSQMTEEQYAEHLAVIITDYIKTAEVKQGIAVTIPATSAQGSLSSGSTTSAGSLQ